MLSVEIEIKITKHNRYVTGASQYDEDDGHSLKLLSLSLHYFLKCDCIALLIKKIQTLRIYRYSINL